MVLKSRGVNATSSVLPYAVADVHYEHLRLALYTAILLMTGMTPTRRKAARYVSSLL